MGRASIELTVCLIIDFPFNDINERRLSGAACESANVLHKVGEARWTSAENALGFFDTSDEVFDLIEREDELESEKRDNFLPVHDHNRAILLQRPSTHWEANADTIGSVLVPHPTTALVEVLHRRNF